MQFDQTDIEIWSSIVHLLPSWTWECDASYRLTHIQMRHGAQPLVQKKDLIGLDIVDVTQQEEDEQPGLGTYLSALRRREEIKSLCYERVLVTGERVALMDCATPVFQQDRFDGYRGITLNLSEVFRSADNSVSLVSMLEKRNQQLEKRLTQRAKELEQRNMLFTEVIEAMGEGLMVTSGQGFEDPETRIMLVNPAFLRLYGMTRDELPEGMLLSDYITLLRQKNGFAKLHEAGMIQAAQAVERGEYVVTQLPSVGRSVRTRAAHRPSGGQVLVHTDVTEIETQNRALRSARDAAEVASRAKSNFLATMSHEIRTPMNGVVGMAEVLAETDLSKEQAEYVQTIRSSALALTSLISDILDFSKVEAGHMEIVRAPFDLEKVFREMSDLLRPLAQAKGLYLEVNIAPDVPKTIVGDVLRLRQVLLNLVGNSIKFTHVGGMTVDVLPLVGDPCLRCILRDTGIGIPEERLPGIFNPFEQVHSGRDRSYEGSGLGLAITKKLIDAMAGQIMVRSQVGKGTEFEIRLPLPPAEGAAPTRALPEIPENLSIEGLRVLLVEDNATNQMVVRKMLEQRGASVQTALDGAAAVQVYDPFATDVVLMDISMPVMTGLEATRHIRAQQNQKGWPHRPIIALTGNAFARDQQEALAAGMDGFLSKPVRRDALLSAILLHSAMVQSATE